MIHFINSDLLTSDCAIICHQVNCVGKMGAGIALRISKVFPLACQVYFNDKRSIRQKIGTCLIGEDTFAKVAHLYGQMYYGRDKQYTEYYAVQSALEEMVCKVKAEGKPFKIGIPRGMGCNNAGGNWDVVLQILKYVSQKHNVDFYVYNYGGK